MAQDQSKVDKMSLKSDYWLSTTETQPMKYTGKRLQPYNNQKTSLPSTSSQGKHYRGVRQRRGERWVAEITLRQNKKRVWLGHFDTAEEAAFAYDTAAYILRGDRAHLNFPDLKHQLKTNSASGAIAARLEAMSTKKAVDLQPTSSKEVLSSENSTSRSEWGYKLENRVGSEIIIENNKKSPDVFSVPDASSTQCTMEPKQQNYAFKSSFQNQPVLAPEQQSHGFTSSNRHLSSQKESLEVNMIKNKKKKTKL